MSSADPLRSTWVPFSQLWDQIEREEREELTKQANSNLLEKTIQRINFWIEDEIKAGRKLLGDSASVKSLAEILADKNIKQNNQNDLDQADHQVRELVCRLLERMPKELSGLNIMMLSQMNADLRLPFLLEFVYAEVMTMPTKGMYSGPKPNIFHDNSEILRAHKH